MTEWMKKLFSEPGTAIVMFSSGAIGFFVGIANGVVQKRHGGWQAFFGSVLIGTIIAAIVGLAVSNYVKAEGLRYAIIGFCAVISDDIWAGFNTLGTMFRNNPLDSISRVLDALRGRSIIAPAAPVTPAAPAQKED